MEYMYKLSRNSMKIVHQNKEGICDGKWKRDKHVFEGELDI